MPDIPPFLFWKKNLQKKGRKTIRKRKHKKKIKLQWRDNANYDLASKTNPHLEIVEKISVLQHLNISKESKLSLTLFRISRYINLNHDLWANS